MTANKQLKYADIGEIHFGITMEWLEKTDEIIEYILQKEDGKFGELVTITVDEIKQNCNTNSDLLIFYAVNYGRIFFTQNIELKND